MGTLDMMWVGQGSLTAKILPGLVQVLNLGHFSCMKLGTMMVAQSHVGFNFSKGQFSMLYRI